MSRIAHESTASRVEDAARAIEAEYGVALGSEARVAVSCAILREARGSWGDPPVAARIEQLAELVAGYTGPLVLPLFELLEEVADRSPHPRGLLEPMLRAGPAALATRALDAVIRAVDGGRLVRGDALVAWLAAIVEARGSPLTDRPSLEKLAPLLGEPARLSCLPSADMASRRLAARILDLDGRPPAASIARAVLGAPAHEFLTPYLDFTRATALDLLTLGAPAGCDAATLRSLQTAEAICGAPLLREAITAIGWSAVNLGLEARPLVGVSIGGGIPLLLSPDDAVLFDGCPGAARAFERVLLVAHGAPAEATAPERDADARIARFRASNLAHAAALADFLDLAPLTKERVERMVASVGALVADFVSLFPAERDECQRVQSAYDAITARIADATRRHIGTDTPAEVGRLVQPFEDPASADEIRTLHGLKRYLHQRGLRLGFGLVRSWRHATRTVSLAVADGGRVTHVSAPIEYADFDPDPALACGEMPYAVRVVAEGFARQLLHGEERLPSVRVFCYGNEVHYFVSYRNHPAFVRIDYSPPFAGGMIDLEYYGVSKYELSHHPNLSLDGVRAFFRRLDFEVDVENTRVHARYDKERARDLADLCARAEALFRLAPYLMDIDWVLGGLDLPREARETAREAWADSFARWGVLPLLQLLTADRRAILLRDVPHPTGPRQHAWRGDLPYRDRLTPEDGGAAAAWIRDRLHARGFDAPVAITAADLAQVPFETTVLGSLRQAAAEATRGHEASRFAALIGAAGEPLADAARLAHVLAPLDRFLQFETTGSVSGHVAERSRLTLPGRQLSVAILRDESGSPGLALVDEVPAGRLAMEAAAVAMLLRAHHFPVGDPRLPEEVDAATLARAFSRRAHERAARPIEGERLTRGVRAAPGVVAGLARFGTAHRTPREMDGTVLVTDRLSPDDGPFLVRACGIVCTGGGVLSHAGLLAAQFGRPALVIDARWTAPAGAGALLQFRSVEYDEVETVIGECSVVERRGFRCHEACLRDGDLVELSADERVLRVLGQDRETLALHDSLRQLRACEARLATAVAPEQLLLERGHRAHAMHQLERLLGQLTRPDLVSFAVRQLLTSTAASIGHSTLLRVLLHGRAREAACLALGERLAVTAERYEGSLHRAMHRIPNAGDAVEVLALRLAARADAEALDRATSVLRAAGVPPPAAPEDSGVASRAAARTSVDAAAVARLRTLHGQTLADLERAAAQGEWARARHILESVDRGTSILGESSGPTRTGEDVRARLIERERAVLAACAGKRVVTAADGGAELQPLIGAKAANLAEVARLDACVAVPEWFAVTNTAFEAMLARPANDHGGVSVRTAIADTVSRSGLNDRQRSRVIADIWEHVEWPDELRGQLAAAYRDLQARTGPTAPRDGRGELFVAVRSSAFEEDRPEETRAGEFDTFLFVAGEESLLEYVKRAWSGLWTPRALQTRAAVGANARMPGGGILVQRIVDPRAAGVIQTINVADARPWEMALDVAFGLGEGVVSGRVAADHATVLKGERFGGGIRFRYVTADKRDRIVFDSRRGTGTYRADTLYHQRMRPALEYAELETLVETAERLERVWCAALDIEFAVDADRLWVLQARPVPAFHAAWRDTARYHPIPQET